MEAFAILVYCVAGLVAAPVFCFVAAKWIRRSPGLSVPTWYGSLAALSLIVLEVVVVWTVGSVKLRGVMGPLFDFIHATAMFLAAPALACVLLLGRRHLARWWPLVAILCWIVGVAGIFHHYDVMDSLYGAGEGAHV